MGAIISQIVITDKYFDEILKKKKYKKTNNFKSLNNKTAKSESVQLDGQDYKYTSLLPCCKR